MERIPTPEPVSVPPQFRDPPASTWYRLGYRAGWHHLDRDDEVGPNGELLGDTTMAAYAAGCNAGWAARQALGR